jgi:hypothetical protein
VLRNFGVAAARRATTTDPTEEVLLLNATALASVDVRALTLAVMDVLPHTKVWVVEDMPLWASEPL